MKYSFPLFFLLLFLSQISFAQDTLRTRYGLLGGLSFNRHTADFRVLPGVPNCCPQFSKGSGTGPLFGIKYELPLTYNSLIDIGLSYIDQSATLTEREAVALSVGGVLTQGAFDHTIDATIGTLNLDLLARREFLKVLFIHGGLRIGLPLSTKYSQMEVIAVPSNGGTFIDSAGNDTHVRTRNVNSGTLPNAAGILMSVVAGISYELPLNSDKTLFLVPSVTGAIAVTNLVSGLVWKPNAIQASVGITYSPKPTPVKMHVFDTLIVRDTTTKYVPSLQAPRLTLSDARDEHSTIETDVILERTTIHEMYLHEVADPHMLQASITAVGLDDEGNETPMATLEIEEFLQFHAHPLLGYIFFNKNESILPSKYIQITKENAANYNLNELFGLDDIEVHHNVLNIIGKRLQEHSKATITLTGCNNNIDAEKDNLNLSKARAEAVKNYLESIWDIDPLRIKTEARGLPEIPSTSKSEDGQAENTRVEITSDDPMVTDVFTANDTTRIATPPLVRFKLNAVSASPIVKYKVMIYQNEVPLYALINDDNHEPIVDHWDWDLTNHQNRMPKFNTPLVIRFTIENSIGDKKIVETTLPTHVRTIAQKRIEHASDVTIDRYNLVLFNFGKSDITPAHERILSTVKSRLKPTSQILIEGYTDRTGTSVSNQKLATNRAKATADAIGRSDARVIGIGDKHLLFPNLSPEGRFFCRTVQITAKTPVE